MVDRKNSAPKVLEPIKGTIPFESVIEMMGRRIKKRARVVFEAVHSEAIIDFSAHPLEGISSYHIEVFGRFHA